ncbi:MULTISPECIES: hypothetical protein [unclassified Acidocella]|uniref:hypothetical protein n=1 Tax=unclassified Acidocella TaxID=2648610 RepID=UPI00028E01A3|nr:MULTISPECIES: hypothetical protein [unclassified Acidocella]EKM98080.1 hypothetical protein MXAZACID_17316 [Acidocella sp. MX-AZ02]WBO58983.1 hypothetical protein GT370_18155 [Acidocella sp. MX-AZ03]
MEIAELIDHLRNFAPPNHNPNSPPPVWMALANGTNLRPESAEIMELLAIVRNRLAKLAIHVNEFTGPEITKDIKDLVTAAIHRLSDVLSLPKLGSAWKDALANSIKAEDATAFRMFSFAMRNYIPLKRLSDEERETAILSVREALTEIAESGDLKVWEKQALLEGYQRVEFILKYFEFFGHEGLSRQMIVTATATKVVAQGALKAGRLKKVATALAVVTALLEAVSAPSDAWHAAIDYERWARTGLASMHDTHKPEQFLLSAPEQASGATANTSEKAEGG